MRLIDIPKVRDDFRKALLDADVSLPLTTNSNYPDRIFDAEGYEVARITAGGLSEREAHRVAWLIAIVVSGCAERMKEGA
jgi:hypothetical protein